MMFTIGINFLNGWYMAAADGTEKRRAEWPPHPDRVFMALTAAALFDGNEDVEELDALRWLESLPPPYITASRATFRDSVTSYVPVNDISSPLTKVKKKYVPYQEMQWSIGRNRQPRRFPIAIPRDPVLYMTWPDRNVGKHRPTLENLASRVTNLGHSASFVQMWVQDNGMPATWMPTGSVPQMYLRAITAGRLDALTQDYNEKRRPVPAFWQGYSRVQEAKKFAHGSVFDSNLIILTLDRGLPLTFTLELTAALRSLILATAPGPLPEWLSGHTPTRKPTLYPHLALFPLPFVDPNIKYADGKIMGLGISLPTYVTRTEAGSYLGPVLYKSNGQPTKNRLFNGKSFERSVMAEDREHPPKTLTSESWTGPSKRWATVTPISLNRHFDGKNMWKKTNKHLIKACQDIDLPAPDAVQTSMYTSLYGALPSSKYPPLLRKDGHRLRHIHATFTFHEEVLGPVLVGAGRFRGYGLCKPC